MERGSVGLPKATQMCLESNVSGVFSEESAAQKDELRWLETGSRAQSSLDSFSTVITEYLSLRNAWQWRFISFHGPEAMKPRSTLLHQGRDLCWVETRWKSREYKLDKGWNWEFVTSQLYDEGINSLMRVAPSHHLSGLETFKSQFCHSNHCISA